MKFKELILFLVFSLLSIFSNEAQSNNQIKTINNLIILYSNEKPVDSLYFNKKNNYVRSEFQHFNVINKTIYMSDRSLEVDKSSLIISKFIIKDNMFVLSKSIAINLRGCFSSNFKIKFNEKGLCWENFVNNTKYKGIIKYKVINKERKYKFPKKMCKKPKYGFW